MAISDKVETIKLIDSSWKDPVIQFSLFFDTKGSSLNSLLGALKSENISILALSFLENSETTVIRCIMNYPDSARKVFSKHSINFFETKVLAVEVNSVDESPQIIRQILSAEVKLYYIYSLFTRPHGKTGIILQTENNEFSAKILSSSGIKIIGQNDIGR